MEGELRQEHLLLILEDKCIEDANYQLALSHFNIEAEKQKKSSKMRTQDMKFELNKNAIAKFSRF